MEELEKRLRELGLIKQDEAVYSINDYSKNCSWKREDSDERHGWSEQVAWWLLEINFTGGYKRKYIMKCPIDTFGSDAIEYFVDNRVQLSKKLTEAGIKVPKIEKYDRGTMIHEYIEGVEFNRALKMHSEKKELYLFKREEIVSKLKNMSLDLLTENTDSNYIVTPEDDVYLIDLDLTKV